MRSSQFSQNFKRAKRFLVQIGTDQQNIGFMCGSRGDKTVGVGICADHVQSVIPLQHVCEQLSVNPGVVRN
jgi:hypothetical protein